MIAPISIDNSILCVAILYGVTTISGILGLVLRQHRLRVVASVFAVAGFLMQSYAMALGHAQTPGSLSKGEYLQILAWFMLICGFWGHWKTKHTTPTILIAPFTLILFLYSLRLTENQVALPTTLSGPFYALHIGAIYLSFALMTLAFATSLMFIYTEKKIKTKAPLTGFQKDFPALGILDKINAFAVMVGFPLFTVGIVSGVIWAGSTWGKAISGDPKEIISFFIWGLFAWLFYMRTVQGRGGRRPAMLTVWLFGLCLFSMLIVNSFMNTHHSFM